MDPVPSPAKLVEEFFTGYACATCGLRLKAVVMVQDQVSFDVPTEPCPTPTEGYYTSRFPVLSESLTQAMLGHAFPALTRPLKKVGPAELV